MNRLINSNCPRISWHSASVFTVLLLIVLFLAGQTVAAPLSLGKNDFLPVDQAFVLTGELQDDTVRLRWSIADGYYLYRHKLSFDPSVPLKGQPGIEDGEEREDEFFGTVQVYHHYLEVTLPVETHLSEMTIDVGYQGCAISGLCYLPQKRTLQLSRFAQTGSIIGVSKPVANLKGLKR